MKLTASRRAGVEQELRRRTLASEKLSICTPLAQTPFPESHLVSSSCGQLSPAAIPIPSTSDFFFGFFGLRLNYISLPGESSLVSLLRRDDLARSAGHQSPSCPGPRGLIACDHPQLGAGRGRGGRPSVPPEWE
ncbi:hypothetical protein C7M84_010342 [Penaeus vannamei]|uniref:Uncharacterized protein n=1 Tax=Penaeus vannamei TaxID=6689 RepID=A0A3R7QLL2_PENVA|nr:hypothetical protein C7M84_010342 [Penaeus vannamei]